MNPMLRGRRDPGIISFMEHMEHPEHTKEGKDPIAEMVECMNKKDLAGCLRTLANHFEAKETEDTPV